MKFFNSLHFDGCTTYCQRITFLFYLLLIISNNFNHILKWFWSGLDNNQLTSIPNEIGKLTSLRVLYDLLSKNNIFYFILGMLFQPDPHFDTCYLWLIQYNIHSLPRNVDSCISETFTKHFENEHGTKVLITQRPPPYSQLSFDMLL